MESLLRWLISGYLVAMVCLGYLMLRSWMVATVISAEPGMVAYQRNFKEGWLRMVVFSIAGSLIWSFIGAAIHYLLGSSESFIRFSLLMALLVTVALLLMRLENKVDAIALNAIVVVGLGLLNSVMSL